METKSSLVALGITKAPKGNPCPTLCAEVHIDGPDYLCQTFCKLLICIVTNKGDSSLHLRCPHQQANQKVIHKCGGHVPEVFLSCYAVEVGRRYQNISRTTTSPPIPSHLYIQVGVHKVSTPSINTNTNVPTILVMPRKNYDKVLVNAVLQYMPVASSPDLWSPMPIANNDQIWC